MTLGERWADGQSFGELFPVFKRVPADDLAVVLERFKSRERLTPTATSARVPDAIAPKRLEAVPEVAALRRAADGQGFVRILSEAWSRRPGQHPKQWTAEEVLPLAIELQRDSAGAFLRLLEAVRRFWDQFPGSPFHALERERVKRFLDFAAAELDLA